MILFGILIVPFFATFVLFFFFKHKLVWWELGLPLLISIILLILIYWFDYFYQTTDVVVNATFIEEVIFEEEWDQQVRDTCTDNVCDENGRNCKDETYDCTKIIIHPKQYYAVNSRKNKIPISEKQFQAIQQQFNNLAKQIPKRGQYSLEGAIYRSAWNKDTASAIVYNQPSYYTNRAKASSHSVFNHDTYSKDCRSDFLLYPMELTLSEFNNQVIFSPWQTHEMLNNKLNYLNAKSDTSVGVQFLVLIYDNLPQEISYSQEVCWGGAKKNQFVITVGMKDSIQIDWSRVFSWTENEKIKLQTSSFINQQKELNLTNLIAFLNTEIVENFKQKDFDDFSYLSIEPSFYTILFSYVLILVVSIVVTVWCIINPIE
jgi:Ca2+/Na+ antiporter